MTVTLEEFRPWKAVVEARLGRLEVASDMHATKIGDHEGLIKAMDKDVTDAQAAFRAQLAGLNAVRATQSDHTAKIRNIDNRLTGVEVRLTGVETRLTSVEGTLEKVNVGVQTIIELLAPANDHGEPGDSPN